MNNNSTVANENLIKCVNELNNATKELNVADFKLKKINELSLKLSQDISNLKLFAKKISKEAQQSFIKATAFTTPENIEQTFIIPDSLQIVEHDPSIVLGIDVPSVKLSSVSAYPELSSPLQLSIAKKEVIKEVSLLIELAQKEKTLLLLKQEQRKTALKAEKIKNTIFELENEIKLQKHILSLN